MIITLRKALESDVHLISAMATRIWREHYTPIIGEAQVVYMLEKLYHPEALQTQMQGGQTFWLAQSEGVALGYLAVSQTGNGAYFLNKFYMDNQKRGLGLGKIIFERLLAQYPDLCEMRLNVNRRNYKSINFYFKIGFIIDFCLETPIGDGYTMDDFYLSLHSKYQLLLKEIF
jgi:ribosomal protein S18 acetylase RimI-like enzyme